MKLIIVIIPIVLLAFIIIYIQSLPKVVNQQTREQCWEYSIKDHEKEIAPERWRVYGEEFKKFDWYKSCLKHSGLE